MKSNRTTEAIIIISFVILTALFPTFINNLSFTTRNLDTTSNYKDNLKISVVSGKIHIDGNSGWVALKAAGNCTGKGTYSDPYVIEDFVIDGGGSGSCILIENSDVYFKIENCTVYNGGGDVPHPLFSPNPISHAGDAGIHLYNVTHALLFNNTCNDSDLTLQPRFYGILLLNSYNNTIKRNLVTQSQFIGIGGIIVSMSNSNVLTENIVNEGEITLIQSNNSIVSGNIMNVDSVDGLLLSYCINTTVTGNNITNRALGELEAGIKLIHSDYNNISKNIAKQRIDCVGIKNNTISGNIIENNNYGPGINLYSCYNNTIEENTINDNTGEGIRIRDSDCNLILRNNLTNNTVGISFQYYSPPGYFSHDDYNIVLGNTITNNRQYGIWFQEDSSFNLIFNNTFIGNSIHAVDNGTGNQWDDGSLGNYWDNYTGSDVNDDGTGDTPYYIPPTGGSMDNYPIWDDGDDGALPVIEIISPITDQVFGTNAPNFQVNKISLYINSTWYTIDGGITNYTFSGLIGKVNQSAWDDKGNEMITLTFYANNSIGLIGSSYVFISKDTIPPKILINSPAPSQLCGMEAPIFSLTIDEPNLQEKWYSFNGGDNIRFTSETQFNQSEWDKVGNGTVLITFNAMDILGHINSSQVVVRKDAFVPEITIISPHPNETYGSTPFNFTISIFESDLVSTWYTVQGSSIEIPFTGLTGTIDQIAWNNAPEGDVTITFYAQDRAGNIGTKVVVVIKSIPESIPEPIIPGYNLLFLLSILSFVAIIISKNLKKS